jgi:hypothetical protein
MSICNAESVRFGIPRMENAERLPYPDVYRVFTELWQERRLDTQRVFLYKGMPLEDVKKHLIKACIRASVTNLRLHDL